MRDVTQTDVSTHRLLLLLLILAAPGRREGGASAARHAVGARRAAAGRASSTTSGERWTVPRHAEALAPARTLRGEEERPRRTAGIYAGRSPSRTRGRHRAARDGAQGAVLADIRKRLQDKLTSLDNRRRMLQSYQCTWAKAIGGGAKPVNAGSELRTEMSDGDREGGDDRAPSHTVVHEQQRGGQRRAEGTTQENVSAGDDSSTNNLLGSPMSKSTDSRPGPDALLRAMNRTGLCRNGELDSRVETFMIKLKKEGKRAELVSALTHFREHLTRPQSRGRRVRNKSALLTKLLLAADRARLPSSPSDTTQNLQQSCDEWSRDLSYQVDCTVSEQEAGGSDSQTRNASIATALDDSLFQVSYPTAVAQRVLRGDRLHWVAVRIEKMAQLLFVGGISKPCGEEQAPAAAPEPAAPAPAASPLAWWASPRMTGKVAYVVSNGRCLDGASLISTSRVTFAAGDTVLIRYAPKDRRVSFFKRASSRQACDGGGGGDDDDADDVLIGTVGNVSGRVRVAAQFKSRGDALAMLPRMDSLAAAAARLAPPQSCRRPPAAPALHQGEHGAAADAHAAPVQRPPPLEPGAGQDASAAGLRAHAGPHVSDARDERPPDRYVAPFGGRKVFVGGTRELDSEEVQDQLHKKFGRVATVKTAQERLPDGGSAPRGFAFATFFDARDARRAVEAVRVNYKKGSVFVRMEIKACDGSLRKQDNDYDRHTAGVLQEADERRTADRRDARLAAMSPHQRRILESQAERTPVVALDCEMVGVGGRAASRRGASALARVCVVNSKGETLYSRFVQPQAQDEVSDYRARITGLSAANLTAEAGAVPFDEARGVVAALLHRRIVVGHALRNDFKVLGIEHPPSLIRDTAKYRPLRAGPDEGAPSLKALAARLLGRSIQVCLALSCLASMSRLVLSCLDLLALALPALPALSSRPCGPVTCQAHQTGVHDPAQDACAAMDIYNMVRDAWEQTVGQGRAGQAARTKRGSHGRGNKPPLRRA